MSFLFVREKCSYKNLMVRINCLLTDGVGQLYNKRCQCLQTARWKIHIMHFALESIPQKHHPPTHTLLQSLTLSRTHTLTNTGTSIEQQSHYFADLDKITLLPKMETTQIFCFFFCCKCTNTKACGLSSIAFMSLPLPSL